jgi:hypothetical protein
MVQPNAPPLRAAVQLPDIVVSTKKMPRLGLRACRGIYGIGCW